MEIDFNQLNELLNAFGLSLNIENKIVTFTDIETDRPMQSFLFYREGFSERTKAYTDDEDMLLKGLPFYLSANNKFYKMSISIRDNKIKVYDICKSEMLKTNLWENIELNAYERYYTLDETTFENNNIISNTSFTSLVTDGSIIVSSNKRSAKLDFIKDTVTEDFYSLPKEEAVQLIEQSKLFKDTMRIISPELAESYSSAKKDIIGQSK